MKKDLKTIPLLLEVVQQGEKVTYIIRQPQTGQVAAICDNVDDVARFLVELTIKDKNE